MEALRQRLYESRLGNLHCIRIKPSSIVHSREVSYT